MQSSQVTNVLHTYISTLFLSHKVKDYLIIVLLSLIGVFGTISCLTGEKEATQTFSIQEMSVVEY